MRVFCIALLGVCFAVASWAQSPAQTKIAEGRAALANHDLAAARASFTAARAADPANETAAALLGITRWFALAGDANTQAYLDGLGVSATGRDVYAWTAELARNGDDAPTLPTGYNLETAVAFWRETLVPAAEAARGDLAAVTSDSFLLTLSAQEAGGVSITIDRGDLLMCQAALRGFEFLTHFLQGQNLDANAARLLELAQGDLHVLATVLEDNPDLMKSGSPSERAAAKATLLDTIALYRRASVFIRSRAEGLERLFNLDAQDRAGEAELRLCLADVERGWSDFVEVGEGRYVTVAPLFSETWSLRDQLPAVTGNKFDPFAVQDSTLGGVALGLTREDVIGKLSDAGLDADLGWEQMNPKPVGQNLNEYVWTGSSHIVVGNAGTIGRSTDGVAWQFSQLSEAKDFYAVAAGAGSVVACGGSDIWMSSDDGASWTRVLQAWKGADYANFGSFTDVVFGDDAFLAISTTGWVWRSTDGEAWERIASVGTTAASLTALTVGDNKFVAVGRDYFSGVNRNAVFTSDDGVTWTPAFNSGTSGNYNGVGYGDGRFLVVGSSGRRVYSADGGVSWSEGIIGTGSDMFYGVAYDGDNGAFIVSGTNGRVGLSSDGNAWSLLEASDTSPFFFDASVGPDGVYLSGSAGSVYRLSNGTLTRVDTNTSFVSRMVAFRDVRAFAGKLYVIGSTNMIFESEDGENYSATAIPVTGGLYSLCEHANKLYAVGDNGTIVVNAGEGWDVVVSGDAELTTATLRKIASVNGRLVAVGAGGTILTSADGAVWTKQASGVTYTLNDVAFGNGMYVVIGSGAVTPVLRSSDLVSWTGGQGYFDTVPQAVAFNGERFIVLGVDGAVYDLDYDADQNYWSMWRGWFTPRAFSDGTVAVDGRYYGAVMAATGDAPRAALPWSYDGEQWLRSSLPGSTAMKGPASFGGRLYVVGGYGGLVRSASLPAGRPAPTAPSQLARTAGEGRAISLGALVSASEPLTYSWIRDGVTIAGANQAVLMLTGIEAADAGEYVVTATGAVSGESVTQTFTLTVEPSVPAIVSQPGGGLASLGGTFVLAVTATGSEPLGYQWYKDGTKLTGETAPVLKLSDITANASGAYHVVVTNDQGSVESEKATVDVASAVPRFWSTTVEGSWWGHSPARTVHDGEGGVFAVWGAEGRPFDVNAGRLIPGLVRLDEDTGTVDPTFTWDDNLGVPLFVAPQPDGHVLVAVSLGSEEGCTVIRVARDGAVDPSYVAPYFDRAIRFITLQSDGKLLVAANGPAGAAAPADAIMVAQPTVYRLNTDGTLDHGFEPVVLTAGGMLFAPPVVDASGRVYLAGTFTEINGRARRNIARVSASGVLDSFADIFVLPVDFTGIMARAIGIQSDGRVVVVGDFRYDGRGTSYDPIMAVRFNADGTFDNSFAQPLRSQLPVREWVGVRLRMLQVLPDDKLLAVSDHVMRLNADGSLDDTFSPPDLGRETFWLSRSPVTGRIYVPDVSMAGGIAAFDTDGTPFGTFNSGGWGRTQSPDSAFMLADGRLLAAGHFNRYANRSVNGAVVFGPAGDVQTTPTPFHNPDAARRDPYSHVVGWSDGSFLLQEIDYGDPLTGTGYNESVRRFHADGTEDRSWSLEAYSTRDYRMTAAPGGRLLLWRSVVDVQALVQSGPSDLLRRFNADGSLDTEFQPDLAGIASVERDGSKNIVRVHVGQIVQVSPLPDDSVLLAITDTQGNETVIKLLADGKRDTTYEAPSFGSVAASNGYTPLVYDPVKGTYTQFPSTTYSTIAISDLLALPDGQAYAAGSFDVEGLPVGIARLLATGEADPDFSGDGLDLVDGPPVLPVGLSLASDENGRVYLAGRFDRVNGHANGGLVRFTTAGALDTAWNPGVEIRAGQLTPVVLLGRHGYLHVLGSVARPSVAAVDGYLRVSLELSAPAIIGQPQDLAVTAGTDVSFTVTVTGSAPLSYQWRKDGVAIAGATAATLTLENVQSADAGGYTVVVTNAAGSATSAVATLTVNPAPVAPSIIVAPVNQTVTAGGSVTFTVSASGTNPLTYEWRKGGVAITGQTGSSLTLTNVQAADAGSYTVQVANAVGSIVSEPATLTVNPRSFAGYYSGSFGSGGGFWAMYIRPDNTGVYIAHLPQRRSILIVNIAVKQDGTFTATSTEFRSASSASIAAMKASGTAGSSGGRAMKTSDALNTTVSALGEDITLAGAITDAGIVGELAGLGESFAGEELPATGGAANRAGLYTASALDGSSGSMYVIVAPSGETFVVADVGGTVDGGVGTVDAQGEVQITTVNATRLDMTVDPATAFTAEITPPDASAPVTFGGLGDGVASTSRLVNLSIRGVAGTGHETLIVGYVTSGVGSKKVLIRAVGPALEEHGITDFLANPRLARFDGTGTLTHTNEDWGGGDELKATFERLGASELEPGSTDAALFLELPPGIATAHVGGSTDKKGVALAEVYDGDVGDTPTARFVNFSARNQVGTGHDVLIAGFVLAGNAPKTLLIRGVGPTLVNGGVTGVLANPQLTLYRGPTAIAANDDWGGTSALEAAFRETGAFGLPADSRDAALLVTLPPGIYTVHVKGVDDTTGIALVEVYEMP